MQDAIRFRPPIAPEHCLLPIAWLAADREILRPDERVRLARYEADRLEPKGVLVEMRDAEAVRQAAVEITNPGRRGPRPEVVFVSFETNGVGDVVRSATYARATHGPIGSSELEHPVKAKRGFRRHARAHERGLTRSGFQARVGA